MANGNDMNAAQSPRYETPTFDPRGVFSWTLRAGEIARLEAQRHRNEPRDPKTSTPPSVVVQHDHARRFGLAIVAATAIAIGGWAIVQTAEGGSQHARPNAIAQTSVLASSPPQVRQYVEGIAAMTRAQIAAAFGTGVQTNALVLASLSPQVRQYVEGIMALTPAQIVAAFGTGH